jgi:hypothetical protein
LIDAGANSAEKSVFKTRPVDFAQLLRYLSHAPGSEGFWRKTSSGGVTKYCVKKTSCMAHDLEPVFISGTGECSR